MGGLGKEMRTTMSLSRDIKFLSGREGWWGGQGQSLAFRNLPVTGRRVLVYLAPTVSFSISRLITDHGTLGHMPYSPPT